MQEVLPQSVEVFGFDIRNLSKNIAFYVQRHGAQDLGRKLRFESQERATLYREAAAEALSLAESATTREMLTGYLNLANGWHTLALEIERVFDGPSEQPQEFSELDSHFKFSEELRKIF